MSNHMAVAGTAPMKALCGLLARNATFQDRAVDDPENVTCIGCQLAIQTVLTSHSRMTQSGPKASPLNDT